MVNNFKERALINKIEGLLKKYLLLAGLISLFKEDCTKTKRKSRQILNYRQHFRCAQGQ